MGHYNSQNGLNTMIRILTLSRLRRTRIAWSLNIRATSAGSPLWAISSCRASAIASCDRNTSNKPSHARSKNSSLWLNTYKQENEMEKSSDIRTKQCQNISKIGDNVHHCNLP